MKFGVTGVLWYEQQGPKIGMVSDNNGNEQETILTGLL